MRIARGFQESMPYISVPRSLPSELLSSPPQLPPEHGPVHYLRQDARDRGWPNCTLQGQKSSVCRHKLNGNGNDVRGIRRPRRHPHCCDPQQGCSLQVRRTPI